MKSPELLRRRFSRGIMAFPATPFGSDGRLDLTCYERHVAFLAGHEPIALVAAGGAGEIFSLTLAEHESVIRATVACGAGLPVVGGAAYGTAMACDMARAVERAGADAVLLLPPYLVRSEQEGLQRHIRAVCASVSIAVIPYSRDNAVIAPDTVLQLAEACPNLIALKDGTGNLAAAERLARRAGERLVIINGAPTAEVFAPRYHELGVHSYSSAVFTFLPSVAKSFFAALEAQRRALVEEMLTRFYDPLVKLRDRKHGYAVSIVKAGLRVTGRGAGPVRPPLIDLDAEEEKRLATLIQEAAEWNR
ncbi:MAG: 5-dehydro-4-deoxyglucarate dehydratase [Steroidobacteraceae bacterium]